MEAESRERFEPSADLAREVERKSGQNPFLCYQCVRCSSGCPLTDFFDYNPNQVMRLVQVGDEAALRAKTPWLCASCLTCTTRCPQGLDIARIMESLTQLARERGIPPAVPEVALFNTVFLKGANLFGRVYELGLFGSMNLLSGNLLHDLDLGVQVLKRGKLNLLPAFARARPDRATDLRPTSKQVGYYPGCSLHSLAREFDSSFRAVAAELGRELVEPKGWTCCGASPAHKVDHYAGLKAPLTNLALLEASGLQEVVAPCAACFNRFRAAAREARADPALRTRLARDMGREYGDSVAVRSISDWLANAVGPEALRERVVRPLEGLKVACYYGCLLTRPPKVTGHPHPEYPTELDEVVKALGAEPLDWNDKTTCCGGSLALPAKGIVLALSRRIVESAQAAGAQVIAVACPLCDANLDGRQLQMEGLGRRTPVLYVTQLAALAFGLSGKAVGLERKLVDPRPVLKAVGLRP
ncbi:MAG: 4Fe-4S dicluster domain-containing protein [Deltaproteobacteria bacterium]|nr:4Fe-4S dicluster domain-containing protein [Deltaproteobacteria bacterium]